VSTVTVGTLGEGTPRVSLRVLEMPGDVVWLIDTGAGVSCLSLRMYRALRHPPPLSPFLLPVNTVEGSPLHPMGCCSLTVDLGTVRIAVPVVVFPTLPAQAIIGWDILQEYNALLDPRHRRLLLAGVCIPLLKAPLCPLVRSVSCVVIPPDVDGLLASGQVKLLEGATVDKSQQAWLVEPADDLPGSA
jgi:hypothetical protein